MEDLLTPQEVADLLRVHLVTVYNWLSSGRLRGRKAGRAWRITESDVNEFMQGQAQTEPEEARVIEAGLRRVIEERLDDAGSKWRDDESLRAGIDELVRSTALGTVKASNVAGLIFRALRDATDDDELLSSIVRDLLDYPEIVAKAMAKELDSHLSTR